MLSLVPFYMHIREYEYSDLNRDSWNKEQINIVLKKLQVYSCKKRPAEKRGKNDSWYIMPPLDIDKKANKERKRQKPYEDQPASAAVNLEGITVYKQHYTYIP